MPVPPSPSSPSVAAAPRGRALIRLGGAPCAALRLVQGAAPLILRRTDQAITVSELALELGSVLLEIPQDLIRSATGAGGGGSDLYRLVFRNAQDRHQFLSGKSWLTQTADGVMTTSLSDGKGFSGTAGIEKAPGLGVPFELHLAAAALAALPCNAEKCRA